PPYVVLSLHDALPIYRCKASREPASFPRPLEARYTGFLPAAFAESRTQKRQLRTGNTGALAQSSLPGGLFGRNAWAAWRLPRHRDRKSTRLNSSHVKI